MTHTWTRTHPTLVALFARAWIEMLDIKRLNELFKVALFARAWIEIELITNNIFFPYVALFARAWIEISCQLT